jgi:thiol-disulfide isomerase/thioredoxin
MRILFLSILCMAAFASAEITEEEGVLILTSDNFDAALRDHAYILVEWLTEMCGNCNLMMPDYEEAAKQLKETGSQIKLAKVN